MDMFMDAKRQYNLCRNAERKKIVLHLKKEGFEVLNENGGRGLSNYTSGKRFKNAYDLSNWMWIEVALHGKKALIALQAFDVDPSSGNHHVLMDRIGICAYAIYDAQYVYANMKVTELDLPMDDGKLNALADILRLALDEG